MLENYNNYGPYVNLIKNGTLIINVADININNWDNHFNSILNIFKDGIETEYVQGLFITVDFGNNDNVDLTIFDYFFNLIMWYLIIRTNGSIRPKHIFFEESITRKIIKNYIDEFFIDENRKNFSNIELNNIIDDALYHYSVIDQFSNYFANTINLEDTMNLMNKSKEFNDILHIDLSGVSIEDVKTVGMNYTNRAIDIMKNSKKLLGYDHCLADSWRSEEGINPKQYKEFSVNIGSKPDGRGGVFPVIINKSFISGGVADILSNFIESSVGRIAQILAKMNVGTSGSFARLLGLNNMDSTLHKDPNYICDTKAYEEIFIKDDKFLHMLNNRYYRLDPKGMEFMLKEKKDKNLIGKKIYLRSPITCASYARGEGICYRCYGDLAYTTRDVNIGRIASEELSSKLTQILLSAKHLLETKIKKLKWSKNFFDIFEVEGNIIKLVPDVNFKDYKIIIDPDNINLENEEDYKKNDYDDEDGGSDSMYNEYITDFIIETSDKELITINTADYDKLYIGSDLNNIIRKKGEPVDGKISINLNDLKDVSIFYLIIHNNELSKTLGKLKEMLDKNSVTKSMDRHQLLQSIIEIVLEGGLDVSSIHCEIILSNQIRSVDEILEKPKWEYPNEPYEILTLNQALTNNPSVVISLSYQRLSKALYNPLTFRKNAPSFMDLFFMEKPQSYLNSKDIKPAVKETDKEQNLISPAYFVDKSKEVK